MIADYSFIYNLFSRNACNCVYKNLYFLRGHSDGELINFFIRDEINHAQNNQTYFDAFVPACDIVGLV